MSKLNNLTIVIIGVIGLLLILIGSIFVIYNLLLAGKAKKYLLEDKDIIIKGTVHKKIKENLDMRIIILIADKYYLPMIMFTEEDYSIHSEGDKLLLRINDTGSIELIETLKQQEMLDAVQGK